MDLLYLWNWKGATLNIHWKDWCWSWSSNTLTTWAKSWLIGKDPDAGKDWRQEEKGMTEEEMVGWHHWLNGHEFDQTPGNGEGQGSLVCCSPWGHKELDTTERLNESNKCQEHLVWSLTLGECSRKDRTVKKALVSLLGLKTCLYPLLPGIRAGFQNPSFSFFCSLFPVRFSSVAQSCPTLCNPMDCSMPGLPVHHQLPEFTQTHAHWVSDAIQPSHPLSTPSPPAFNRSQYQSLFKWVSSSHQVNKELEFQLQHQSFQWTPRTDPGLVGSPCSWRDSQESSPTPQFQSIDSLVLSFSFQSPTVTSIHDYWKNHSLD